MLSAIQAFSLAGILVDEVVLYSPDIKLVKYGKMRSFVTAPSKKPAPYI